MLESVCFSMSFSLYISFSPRNVAPLALDFRAYGARKLVTKIHTSTPDCMAELQVPGDRLS